MVSGNMTLKLSNSDRTILIKVLDKQFISFYRITNKEMSLGERLLFEKLMDSVIGGFSMELDKFDSGDDA